MIETLNGIFGETEKETRRYLGRFVPRSTWEKIQIQEINDHATLKPNERWGLVSDAGLPCIADPGASIVQQARKMGIEVEAVVGPCSITLALQLSGLIGQRFAFLGYLPREAEPLRANIIELEKRSKKEASTQIFIETPYRNQKVFQSLLDTLQPKTFLCVAQNLTGPSQQVRTQSIGAWRREIVQLEKSPAIFLVLDG